MGDISRRLSRQICFILVFCFVVSARGDEVVPCLDQLLTEAAIRELRTAQASRHYSVSILTRERNGKPQTLVLFGEIHIKTKYASTVGKEVLKQFREIGVETADAKQYLGGKAFKYSVRLIFLLGKMLTLGRFSHPDAVGEAFALSKLPNGPKVVKLENGHKPDFAEHYLSVQIPASIIVSGMSLVLCLAHALFPDQIPAEVTRDFNVATSIVMGPGTLVYLGSLIGDRILPLRYRMGILSNRNRTMVQNIDEYLDENPDIDQMLVIVGSGHVRGMRQDLTQNHGFIEVPLASAPVPET